MDYFALLSYLVLFGAQSVWSGKADLCKMSKLDSAFTDMHKVSYIFLGDRYWKYGWKNKGTEEERVENAYKHPHKISSLLIPVKPDVPIDAAFHRIYSKKSYLFLFQASGSISFCDFAKPKAVTKCSKNSFFHKFNRTKVDASFLNDKTNVAFFFIGDKYMTFDFKIDTVEAFSALRPISELGLPSNLDAGLYHPNGKMFVFKGTDYWALNVTKGNRRKFEVIKKDPPYPKNAPINFFGCPDPDKPVGGSSGGGSSGGGSSGRGSSGGGSKPSNVDMIPEFADDPEGYGADGDDDEEDTDSLSRSPSRSSILTLDLHLVFMLLSWSLRIASHESLIHKEL